MIDISVFISDSVYLAKRIAFNKYQRGIYEVDVSDIIFNAKKEVFYE